MIETLEWLKDPTLMPKSHRDSSAFVSAVTAIFSLDASDQQDDYIKDYARDVLRYLLLRRLPSTDELVEYEHPPPSSVEIPERVEMLRGAIGRVNEKLLFNRKAAANPFPTMILLTDLGTGKKCDWSYGGELPILLISTWLLTRDIRSCDVCTQNACLSLYSKHKLTAPDRRIADEFTSDRLSCAAWIAGEIDRLCGQRYSTNEILREVSYLGCFASLVIASRMQGSGPLQNFLLNEVKWLQTATTTK